MIFYVRRTLPSGLIRFGVGERADTIAQSDDLFSTGPSGEYRRHGESGLYFAEERGEAPPQPASSEYEIRRLSSFSVASKILIGAGGFLVFWGILLFSLRRDPIAWILILIGLGMIATPIVRTRKLRRELREQAERERVAREEEERRTREIVGEFASLLQEFQRDHNSATAERLRQARQQREIPYDAVAPLARETVLLIGFDALSRFGSLGAHGAAREIDSAVDAVGLNDADRQLVKRHLYQKLVWHLLAADRHGPGAADALETLKNALRISDEELAVEQEAITQFGYLRGLGLENLPRVDSPVLLKLQEVCHHRSRGELRKPARRRGWSSAGDRYLTVTSRRLILSNRKETEIRHEDIRNIDVDADLRLLTIETAEHSHVLAIPDPIYTAGVIAIASETPRKPKGLV